MKLDASREFGLVQKITDNILTGSELTGDDEVLLDLARCLAVTIGRIYGHYKMEEQSSKDVLMRQQLDEALKTNGLQRTKED